MRPVDRQFQVMRYGRRSQFLGVYDCANGMKFMCRVPSTITVSDIAQMALDRLPNIGGSYHAQRVRSVKAVLNRVEDKLQADKMRLVQAALNENGV
jgi:hypothetical protein